MGQNRVNFRNIQGGPPLRVSRARDPTPHSIPLPCQPLGLFTEESSSAGA